MTRATIRGLQEAQRDNEMRIAALRPGGGFARAIWYGLQAAFRFVLGVTHVDTGGLRASHRMYLEAGFHRGIIDLDPSAVNPRGGRPAKYGPAEHARGGNHAFYWRTENEGGPRIVQQVERHMAAEMRV